MTKFANMKFKEIYNPKHVYEGFFESYFIRPFVYLYFKFQGHESIGSCVRSLLAWLVITLGIVGIMMGQIGLIGPDGGIQLAKTVFWIWIILSICPMAALFSRTAQGSPERPIHARMLGIDTLLGVSCLLFFVLGLLMMVTTLDSGELNPNARVVDEADTSSMDDEYISEEPIFTYQDESAETPKEPVDTLTDMNEPDLMEAEESFDPTIQTPADIEPILQDSI